jgi:hypothetical protein
VEHKQNIAARQKGHAVPAHTKKTAPILETASLPLYTFLKFLEIPKNLLQKDLWRVQGRALQFPRSL